MPELDFEFFQPMILCVAKSFISSKYLSSKDQKNIWFNVMLAKYVVRNILCIFHFPKIPRCFPYNNNLLKKDVETGNVPQSRARGHSITTRWQCFALFWPPTYLYVNILTLNGVKNRHFLTPYPPTSNCTHSFWTTLRAVLCNLVFTNSCWEVECV